MTEELKHSPLPWSYPAQFNIYDADSEMVAHGYRFCEETPANMKLIVESVNNAAAHTEREKQLVDALEGIKNHQETLCTGRLGDKDAHEFTVAWQIASKVLSQHKETK